MTRDFMSTTKGLEGLKLIEPYLTWIIIILGIGSLIGLIYLWLTREKKVK